MTNSWRRTAPSPSSRAASWSDARAPDFPLSARTPLRAVALVRLRDRAGGARLLPRRVAIGMALVLLAAAGLDSSWPFAATAGFMALAGFVVAGWPGVYLAEILRAVPADRVGVATGGAAVVFGSGWRDAVAKAVELLGIDGVRRELARHRALERRPVRDFDGHGRAVRRSRLQYPVGRIRRFPPAVFERPLAARPSGAIDDADPNGSATPGRRRRRCRVPSSCSSLS